MQRFLAPAVAAGFVLASFSAPICAQSPFATSVVAFEPGSGAGSNPDLALAGPKGAGLGLGSLDALSLGEGGRLTLGFDVTVVDGPGADLTVFENPFLISGGPSVFAEILFVEVSSDGATYARFPSRYAGAGSAIGSFRGLAGGVPVIADVTDGLVDPLDPAVSGGEAFDLADLAPHPAVVSGAVDLQAIRYVRLVDCASGDVDDLGTPLPAAGAGDVDAVAVLCSDATADPGRPVCDLFFDAQERLHLVVGDPQGFFTLDLGALKATLDLESVPLTALLSAFDVLSVSPTELHLVTAPLSGTGFLGALGLSVRDHDGLRSGDQAMVQG